ncbi:hypothetical protein [Pseudogemmobacter blasticus]|uniref:hypothetical protein n=1 Tax=Fuscovulum blasticum TaxID=1075 RepID=UPI0015E75C8F|nr:hypothetical protein [Fuscovulum blasticum]
MALFLPDRDQTTHPEARDFPEHGKETAMKGILAWVIGIPIPIIIILYLTDVF